MLNVDLEKSRLYEFRGGQEVVERPNLNALVPTSSVAGRPTFGVLHRVGDTRR